MIATEETDLVAEVMKITDGKGARIVFDPVGGPYVQTLAEAMAVDGTLFIYGGLSGQPTMHPHWPAAFKNLSIRGWVASTIWNYPERFARSKALILKAWRRTSKPSPGSPEARDRAPLPRVEQLDGRLSSSREGQPTATLAETSGAVQQMGKTRQLYPY